MGVCSAGNCANSHKKGVWVTRFPGVSKHSEKKELWREAVARSRLQPEWHPTDSSRVCEVHFDSSQLKKDHSTGRTTGLLEDAIPWKFCFCSTVPLKRTSSSMQQVSISHHEDHTYARRRGSSVLKSVENNSENIKKRSEILHKDECPFSANFDEESASHFIKYLTLQREKCALQQQIEKQNEEIQINLHAQEVLKLLASHERNKNDRWDNESVKNGISARFSSGSSGYVKSCKTLSVLTPSIRTLQRRVQHIKFLPGIQYEFIKGLKEKLALETDDRDRDACLLFDEFALLCRRDYDPGTKTLIGLATVPEKEENLATKCQIHVFAGCHRKWRQIVGWHLLPSECCGTQISNLILELLRLAEEINVNVICIVCDMGNRKVLAELGFQTLKDKLVYKIPNPANPLKVLRCLPDPVHVIKSCKECLISNEFIELPDNIVEMFDLPSNRIELQHLEWLAEIQEGEDWKFAPRLQLKDINSKHFRKMKASSAFRFFSHPVASALHYLCVRGMVPVEAETTAWFIKLFNRFSELVTSRNPTVAFSLKNMKKYEEAVLHLKLVIDVFKNMKVGSSKFWKPLQTHVIMICECILDLQQHLLQDRSNEFVFTGRFSQDIVENIISCVRMQRPKCSSLEAKYRLKQLAISQFQHEIKKGSYSFEEVPDYVDVLLFPTEETPSNLPTIAIDQFVWVASVPVGGFHRGQEDILYRVSGYVVHALISANSLKCSGCIESLRISREKPHEHSLLLKIMNYKENAQFEVSDELFQIFRLIDYNILQWKPKLVNVQSDFTPLIKNVILPAVICMPLSTCHDVKEILVKRFSNMKIKQASKLLNHGGVTGATVYQASPSLAGGHFVESYQPGQYKKSGSGTKPIRKQTSDNMSEEDVDEPSIPQQPIKKARVQSSGMRRLKNIP